MKRIAALVMILILALSLLVGCGGPAPTTAQSSPSKTPGGIGSMGTSAAPATVAPASSAASAKPSANSGSNSSSDPVSLKPATNPSEGYNNYVTVKGKAIDRITSTAEKSDSLAMTVTMSLLGMSMIDLSLIPLTVFGQDAQATQMALGFLGMKDVKVSGGGSDFQITYTDSNGKSIKQTAKYDKAKDTMSSTLYDADGKISIFFEYVNVGNNTYAAQYYYSSDNGGFEVSRAYFDKDNVAAFGSLKAPTQPASIIGKSGLNADFVKNEEQYMVLKDGKLTVFDKGTTTTN